MSDRNATAPAPTEADLHALAERMGWALDPRLAATMVEAIDGLRESYAQMDEWGRSAPSDTPSRAHRRPDDDPAWAVQCDIAPTGTGPLDGLTVAVKDSVAIAGLPTVMGSRILADDRAHIARTDATVVRRLLDAGARITGKAMTEDLCIGGSSCTSQPLPVDNPLLPGRSAGGSSSGSAVLLARGEVDLALGADQGGSIRIPAALCDVVGLKPTFGLIPFTGIQGLVWGLDHVGPMARDVVTVARALDVLAGSDGIDRRCAGATAPHAVAGLSVDVRGWRIGLVTQGFDLTALGEDRYPGSAAAADLVRERAGQLADRGFLVKEVSLPWHDRARDVYGPLLLESAVASLWRGFGRATADINWAGDTPVAGIVDGLLDRPDLASPPTQLVALAGTWFLESGRGRGLDRASAWVVHLRRAYDEALDHYDVLVHPTTAPAGVAGPLSTDPVAMITESLAYFHNTCATNLTGHPSVSVPVGRVDGAPVGMHITGRHGGDAAVLRVAAAVEDILSR